MTLISPMLGSVPAEDGGIGNRPVPKIRIEAFCETNDVLDVVATLSHDRHLMRASIDAGLQGVQSAIARYRTHPSPDLVILERQAPGDLLIEELEKLAEVCDACTRVIVIGALNDIDLYRNLLGRGISDYLVAPIEAPALIASVVRLYQQEDARKLGRTYAFVGAKGGVGSSTIAHNVAATMADDLALDVILADLDLPFGTAGLDFNLDSPQGVADALDSGAKLDELLFERLLSKCSERLSMLAAPASLDRPYDQNEEDFDNLIDIARVSTSHLVLDMPHQWSSWSRRMLLAADEIVVTAAPDLANLRNTKALLEALRKSRPNDAPPKVILNQVGMAKRPEIKPAEFAKAIGFDPVATISFDPKLYGTAANNGQMIADVAKRSAAPFATISSAILKSGAGRGARGSAGLLSRLGLGRRSA
ncbi:pilus assembly protein CpaE [Palleronia aestuarii]|uniref:Pilus assembly protein CpaE n=1 Tax=Palleronia aestuarii TaxID=568105 RepID=A0A2W7MYU2_9RHOB|nr:CtpF protein [Palleronia aestuarii]PZX13118.1 pilus assembly protein CpaE [Palleronia aestuarii]